MKPEVIRPRSWSPSRLLIAVLIAYTGWSLSRVLEGLERADRAAQVKRGPACTSTVYYPPNCPRGACQIGEGATAHWWCAP